MQHLFSLNRVMCTEGSALLPSHIPDAWREKRQNSSSSQHEALLQRHCGKDCAPLAEMKNNYSFCCWTFSSGKDMYQGDERSWTLCASSIYATISDMPPIIGSNLCENEECATNAMVFFKNFCFPEKFDNPASTPAEVWQAVWPGILAEMWNLFSPMHGLLATHVEVMWCLQVMVLGNLSAPVT